MIYVMSDLHSHYREFSLMLEEINFSKEDSLYILGDAIDKGKEELELIKAIRERPNITLLKGNHENILLSNYCNYGTVPYLYRTEDYIKYLDYFSNLPIYKIIKLKDKIYFLSHGGLSSEPGTLKEKINSLDEYSILYERNLDSFIIEKNVIQIIGHTPIQGLNNSYIKENIPFLQRNKVRKRIKNGKILFIPGKILIDTGLGANFENSKLACLRLDDMKEFYIPKI